MERLETFKEISIGGLSKEQLIQKLTSNGIQFNKYAEILFDHPTFAPQNKIERVNLVRVKLSDFDLDNPSSYQELIKRASTIGLKLCPLYLAGFLRLNFLTTGPKDCSYIKALFGYRADMIQDFKINQRLLW